MERESEQRISWISQFVDRRPINFIHTDRNHYVALLFCYDDTMIDQRHTYHNCLMYNAGYQALKDHLP
jgi:hypothetical protein